MKNDLSTLAADMDKVLNSDENKDMFSNSSMLEKLAFKKVSEQEEVSEVEVALGLSLKKTAGCCECGEEKHHECKCECHDKKEASTLNSMIINGAKVKCINNNGGAKDKLTVGKSYEVIDEKKAQYSIKDDTGEVNDWTKHRFEKEASVRNPAREAFNALLKVSEDLESAGFERLAAASILLADKLITEAKAKSSKKSDKSEKSKGSEKSKSKGKKMDMKERMEKMRKMQKGKGKKDSKKSEKK